MSDPNWKDLGINEAKADAKVEAPKRDYRPKMEDAADKSSEEPRRTRRSRLSSNQDEFYVPEELKKRDWSYQWWAIKVANQEVDNAKHVAIADGGWEACRPNEMPGLMPGGYKGNTIDRWGMRLYKRPSYLTQEAMQEDLQIARAQKQAKIQQALSQPSDSAPRVGTKLDIGYG